jgi:hypothetical protein
VVTEYEALYDPIVGASDGQTARRAVQTPELQLQRTFNLKKAYTELHAELIEEIALIDDHVMKPAADARDSIAPIRKTIKKREDKRLDYEKTQEKTLKLQRKPGRTPKEDAAFAKADAEMSRAAEVRTEPLSPMAAKFRCLKADHAEQEFRIADEHLRATLPPIIAASFNLVAPLLSNLVLIQNRLLGLYYTTLHGYCEEFAFPSPPPPMEDVIATWNAAFSPVRSEVESVTFIARGKAAHRPMDSGNGASSRQAQPPMSAVRRASSGLIPGPKPRTMRVPSMPLEDQTPSPAPSYRRPDYSNATEFTTATILGGAAVSRSAGGPSVQREPISPVGPSSLAQFTNGLGKKKPPPPPPPKRSATTKPDEWVVALYPFTGEAGSDLSFEEGARIRVVKRTETDQDWYVCP